MIDDSVSSGWLINKEIYKIINNLNSDSKIFLLRHNIASNELVPIANSKAGLKEKLPSHKKIDNLINKDIFIISGDSGAFKELPRFFCRKDGKITYIVNGLGGIEGDIILIISNNKLYKYRL